MSVMPVTRGERVKSRLLAMLSGEGAGAEGSSRELHRLARAALRQARGGREASAEEVEDLAGDFTVRVYELAERSGGRFAQHAQWAAMAPAQLQAFVRRIFHNLAVEKNEGWNTLRTLRDLVSTAREAGWPPPAGWPEVLRKGARFHRPWVAQACRAWLDEAGPGASLPSDLELARLLAERYGLAMAAHAPRGFGEDGEEADPTAEVPAPRRDTQAAAEVAEEAAELVRCFEAAGGAEAGRLLGLRALGFKEMARVLGVALATAHERFQKALALFRAVVERLGADLESARVAYEALAEKWALRA